MSGTASDERIADHLAALEKSREQLTARCLVLELRDRERAKEIMKARAHIMAVERAAKEDRRLRVEAEANASRFHALLLQERVRKIGADS